MNGSDHLALRLARLKTPDELIQKGEGLFFIFAKGGAGKFTSPMATRRLIAGDVLVFDGNAGGRLAVDEGKGEFLYWVYSASFESLLPLFGGNEISLLQNITEGFKASRVYPANSPLAMECQRLLGVVPPDFNLDHRGQLVRITASILSVEFKEAQARRGGYVRSEDHMVQVFEKLSASEIINLSVGELAERFSCSRRHLNRLFHQHFGVSVASLRMEMRLLKAISLLRDPNAKIINVAEQCGFNHLGLFNTCFKRRFGTSPGQWRKNSPQPEMAPPRKLGTAPECPLHASGQCPLSGQEKTSMSVVKAIFSDKAATGSKEANDLKPSGLMVEGARTRNARSQARAGE